MSDLDPAIMDQFYMKDGVSASDVTHVSLEQPRSDALLHPAAAVWGGLYCCDL